MIRKLWHKILPQVSEGWGDTKPKARTASPFGWGRQPAGHSLPAQGTVLARSPNQSHQDKENYNQPTEVVSLHMPLKTSFQCLILKSIFRNILVDHLIWNSNPRKSSSTGLHSHLWESAGSLQFVVANHIMEKYLKSSNIRAECKSIYGHYSC